MKITLEHLSVFFYFNCVSRVFSSYIYDDIANVRGFLPSTDGLYARTKMNGHIKYFNSQNPKYQKLVNERSVDSHFRVIKSSGFSNSLISSVNGREQLRNFQKYTIPSSNLLNDITVTRTKSPSSKQVTKHSFDSLFPDLNKSNINSSRTKKPTTDTTKENVYINANTKEHDCKQAHSSSHSEIPKVYTRQNPRHGNTVSTNRSLSSPHKLQYPLKINKTVHKNANDEKSISFVRRVLTEKTGKLSDKIQQKMGRKRDISGNEDDIYLEKNKYYTMSDNVMTLKRAPVDQAIIANIVDDTDFTNSPYAVFYRMSPDITEQQDGYMIMNPRDERTNNLYKEREAAMNYETEMSSRQSNYRKFANGIKMHGKLKNFSNFRNF